MEKLSLKFYRILIIDVIIFHILWLIKSLTIYYFKILGLKGSWNKEINPIILESSILKKILSKMRKIVIMNSSKIRKMIKINND